MAGGAGYRPTNAAVGVFKDLRAEMVSAQAGFDRLMKDVEAFNRAQAGKVPAIGDRQGK